MIVLRLLFPYLEDWLQLLLLLLLLMLRCSVRSLALSALLGYAVCTARGCWLADARSLLLLLEQQQQQHMQEVQQQKQMRLYRTATFQSFL